MTGPLRYDERPSDETPVHTADLPPTPTRDRNIVATAWIEAPGGAAPPRRRSARRAGRHVQAADRPVAAVACRPGERRRRSLLGRRCGRSHPPGDVPPASPTAARTASGRRARTTRGSGRGRKTSSARPRRAPAHGVERARHVGPTTRRARPGVDRRDVAAVGGAEVVAGPAGREQLDRQQRVAAEVLGGCSADDERLGEPIGIGELRGRPLEPRRAGCARAPRSSRSPNAVVGVERTGVVRVARATTRTGRRSPGGRPAPPGVAPRLSGRSHTVGLHDTIRLLRSASRSATRSAASRRPSRHDRHQPRAVPRRERRGERELLVRLPIADATGERVRALLGGQLVALDHPAERHPRRRLRDAEQRAPPHEQRRPARDGGCRPSSRLATTERAVSGRSSSDVADITDLRHPVLKCNAGAAYDDGR